MGFEAEITKSKIFDEVYIFKPTVGRDRRGSIFTTYDKVIYDKFLPDKMVFNHDKFAESKQNVLRGLHGDAKTWKLVTCVCGEIFQVVADMRSDSDTYLKWESWTINSDNKIQVLVPPNFVNGYYVMSDHAVFHYKLAYEGEYFDVKDQNVLVWNDPRLAIKWPCIKPILHKRDQ